MCELQLYVSKYSEETPMAKLCVGRFQPLHAYFKDIELEDIPILRAQDFDSIIDKVVPPSLHGLARVFYRKGIEPRRTQPASTVDDDVAYTLPYSFDSDLGVLSFAGRVQSADEYYGDRRYLSSKQLADTVLQCFKDAVDKVAVVDLSFCGLQDHDIPYIQALVDTLPKLSLLNLCLNRLGSLDDRISTYEEIVNLLDVAVQRNFIVDITGNPLATVGDLCLFSTILNQESYFRHLIWLPSPVVQRDVWLPFVETRGDSKQVIVATVDTHKKYYDKPLFVKRETRCVHAAPRHEVTCGKLPSTPTSAVECVAAIVSGELRLCSHAHCKNRFPIDFQARLDDARTREKQYAQLEPRAAAAVGTDAAV